MHGIRKLGAGIAVGLLFLTLSPSAGHADERATAAEWTAPDATGYSNSCSIVWTITGQVNFGSWTCTLTASATGSNCEDIANVTAQLSGNILAFGCTATLTAQTSGDISEVIDGTTDTWSCTDNSLIGTLHYISVDTTVNLTVPVNLVQSGTTQIDGASGNGTSFNTFAGDAPVIGNPGPGLAVVQGDTSQNCVAIPGALPVFEGQITF